MKVSLLAGILVVILLGHFGAANQDEGEKGLEVNDKMNDTNAEEHVVDKREEHRKFRHSKSPRDRDDRDHKFHDTSFKRLGDDEEEEENSDFIHFDEPEGGWDALLYIDNAVFYNTSYKMLLRFFADGENNDSFIGYLIVKKKETADETWDEELMKRK
ncbi:hypothetical protein Aperf_G00000113355 [Anoplocephala perfoliata]